MSLSELSTNLNHVRSLADKPSLQGDSLKSVFDTAGNEIKEYINQTLTKEIDQLISDINTQIQTDENRLTQAQLNKIYPVGSLYMSVNNTNPSTLFGGTWSQIKDRFLLGVGNTYTSVNATGGEATHTLTINEMPSHTHTFTGVAHNHGLNSHKHTYSKSATTTGSTALTVEQIPAHRHNIGIERSIGLDGALAVNGLTYLNNTSGCETTATGGSKGHTHSITLSSTNTGAASGNTANTTATGTNANTGGGQAHNNMPPYITVYMWKRTQ